RGVLDGDDALIGAEVRFLASSGDRHQAAPQRLELPPVLALSEPVEAEQSAGELVVGLRLSSERLPGGGVGFALRVENRPPRPDGLDRAAALRASLLSTPPLLRLRAGRFRSPLDGPHTSVNTYPVLVTPCDDVLLGAAIVLPDHPQVAPESLGSLFDSTEIE